MTTSARQPLPISPGAELDISWSWADWLQSGESLINRVITVPSGVTLQTDEEAAGVVTAWVVIDPATAPNTLRQVLCAITTSQGRKDSRVYSLLVGPH